MALPYVGEIRMFAGNFAPVGWAFCNGQELPIAENETLFQLIGTTYGGDGQNTFALPNLQGRVPIHVGIGPGGSNYSLSNFGGVENVTLSVQQIPAHTHAQAANAAALNSSPAGNLSANTAAPLYGSGAGTADLHALASASVGGSQPHSNLMPYLCLNFIVSLSGIFPSQT